MVRDFRKVAYTLNDGSVPLLYAAVDGTTTIEEWDVITITSGYAVKAWAASAKIAIAEYAVVSWDWQTEVGYYDPRYTIYEGTADANFAVTQRNSEVDLVVSGSDQLIDSGSSATDVFTILNSVNTGTVGSALNIKVRINKPIS